MIENELELRNSYDAISKMYALRDRMAADATGHPETRRAELDGVQAMIQKIERQIASYLAARTSQHTHPA